MRCVSALLVLLLAQSTWALLGDPAEKESSLDLRREKRFLGETAGLAIGTAVGKVSGVVRGIIGVRDPNQWSRRRQRPPPPGYGPGFAYPYPVFRHPGYHVPPQYGPPRVLYSNNPGPRHFPGRPYGNRPEYQNNPNGNVNTNNNVNTNTNFNPNSKPEYNGDVGY